MAVASTPPERMNQAAFADLAGVSRKTVTKWKQKGFVVVDDEGLVDVERSVALLRDRGYGNFADVTPAEPAVTPPEEAAAQELTAEELAARLIAAPEFQLLTHAEAERLKENYLALAQRLKYEREAGRLVLAEEVEARHAARWSAERTAWENWPSAVCADMAAQIGVDAIRLRVVLEAAVEAHLAERVREGTDDASPAG